MTNEILSAILEPMQNLIEKSDFFKKEDNCFQNDKIAFKIVHDEDKKMLYLEVAEVGENNILGDYEIKSSWLFEESENLRDAASAGMDFNDTVKSLLGIRKVRTGRGGEVVLPGRNAGDAKNIDALCGRLLAIFPQYKEDYKEHVFRYGSLLYIKFFSQTFAVQIGEMLDQNNKKSLKKLFDCLGEMYNIGDRTTQNAVVGILLGGAVKDNKQRYDTALEYLEDYAYLKTAFVNIMPKVNSDKKFKSIFS